MSSYEPLESFSQHQDTIRPDIAEWLDSTGEEVQVAYGALDLYHNTLVSLVPSVLAVGLRPDSELGSPDPEDVKFAEDIFKAKGFYEPAKSRQFDVYVKGIRGDREPGVFLYPISPDDHIRFNQGYGVPERMHILAHEMGCVMLQGDVYTEAERTLAADIFYKYKEKITVEQPNVAVLEVDPFSPAVIDARLGEAISQLRVMELEKQAFILGRLGLGEWEGLYIPGIIPECDIRDTGERVEVADMLDENKINPKRSRFYYTPPHLQCRT